MALPPNWHANQTGGHTQVGCVVVYQVRFIASKSGRTDYALAGESVELSCLHMMKDEAEDIKQLVWSKDGKNVSRRRIANGHSGSRAAQSRRPIWCRARFCLMNWSLPVARSLALLLSLLFVVHSDRGVVAGASS